MGLQGKGMTGTNAAARWVAVSMLALSTLAGCGGLEVWEEFDKIEVGKPLPAELPEGMQRTHLGASLVALPIAQKEAPPDLVADLRLADAICDDSGVVIAKSNLEFKLAYRPLFIAGSYKYVIELDVPAEAFHGLPWYRQIPRELPWAALVSQISAALPISDPNEADEPAEGATTQPTVTTATLDELTSIQPVEYHLGTLDDVRGQVGAILELVRKSRETFMKESWGGLGLLVLSKRSIDALMAVVTDSMAAMVRLMCLPYVVDGEAGQYTPKTVAEAVLYHKILLDAATSPQADGEFSEIEDEVLGAAFVATLIYMKWIAPRVIELLSDRYALAAATREGSDRIVPTLDGMSVRVRNLGGRRVRVEVGGFVIRNWIPSQETLLLTPLEAAPVVP